MKKSIIATALSTLVLLSACESDSITEPVPTEFDFTLDFSQQAYNAEVIFSDYPVGEETFYELASEHAALPELDQVTGWKLSGNNHSDDLMMALVAPISGLKSSTLYKVTATAEIWTNVQKNCVGIGGAPGESVYFKLGASQLKPAKEVEQEMYRLTPDLGQQSNGSVNAEVVGNIANDIECGEQEVYQTKTLSMSTSLDITSDADGQLWLIAASDSGFEGTTTFYIKKLVVNVSE